MADWKLKFDMSKRLRQNDKYIWEETMEKEIGQVDIWRGCPDFAPSKDIIKALTDIATNEDAMLHQYTLGTGHPRLVSVLSKIYTSLINYEIEPEKNIMVAVGVYGAIYNIIYGNIADGDEVIVIEPVSDFYDSVVRMAGGVPIYVPLRLKSASENVDSKSWTIDIAELEKAFNSKTKIIIIETPNVNLGKIYTKEELQEIANLCKKWNVVCVAIEADEFLIFDSEKSFTRIGTLPHMQQRTVSIGSADSTFFLKGWKVAWAYGSPHIIKNSQTSLSNSIYVCTTVLQEALAVVLEKELPMFNKDTSYFKTTVEDLMKKRKIMFDVVGLTGMKPILPDSGIFMVADWSSLENKIKSNLKMELPDNFDFVKWFLQNSGIQAVPLSMFFSKSHASIAKNMIRFCFNKKYETLQKAKDLLEGFVTKIN